MKKIKNPIKDFMGSIDNMTIAKKTSLLFAIMVAGMLFIGSFAHMSLNRIKGDFDVLYNKRMVPVIRLEKLKDIYTVNILDTLRDIESEHINVEDGKRVILLAQELIRRDWIGYKASLLIDDKDWITDIAEFFSFENTKKIERAKSFEDDMIYAIEYKITHINSILVEIFKLFEKNQTLTAFKRLKQDLYPSINSINIHIAQLISLNLDAASIGRKRTEAVYENTFDWIVVATIGTITVAALLAIVILQNIRLLHGQLAKMVDIKTKELQDLNSALEDKIALEVERSRQKNEIMFRQSRLAAMGEMIGNIAHQWRQPLNAMVLIIQSFQMKKMVGKLDDEFIDVQVDEGIKIAAAMSRTIDDFRNFFKPNKKEEYFGIQSVINESIDLVYSYYKKFNININLICKEDFITLGYANEFSQVMMNLFSNSKDILKDKDSQKKHIEIVVIVNNEEKRGKISIIDNGGGVPIEVMDRMFEPYFTTKHQSSGTGIGLYMSKEIIENQMHGSIEVENISHKFLGDNKVYKKCACINILIPIRN